MSGVTGNLTSVSCQMSEQAEPTSSANPAKAIKDLTRVVTEEVSRVVIGQERACKMLIGSLLASGHVLLEGPPGIAKTLLARTLAEALGLAMKRIQFTPDLMPNDITGVYVFDEKKSDFRFSPGPIFSDILLADELNRTPPKTQAALLQAMEEHQVTIDGIDHELGDNFFVVATQNPLEYEGTFPLPEAQLDRFFCRVRMTYPQEAEERRIINELSKRMPVNYARSTPVKNVISKLNIEEARLALRAITLSASIAHYIQSILQQTRILPELLLGVSSRAGVHLALAARLEAAWQERNYVIPDDVKAMAPAVLSHRIVVSPSSSFEEHDEWSLIERIVNRVPIPPSDWQESLY